MLKYYKDIDKIKEIWYNYQRIGVSVLMKNNKGQALIEFILILPILLILTIGIFDLFNIQNKKYELANDLDYISELYINNKENEIEEYLNKKEILLTKVQNENFLELTLTKKVNLITPGLNKILENPFTITVKRSVYDE